MLLLPSTFQVVGTDLLQRLICGIDLGHGQLNGSLSLELQYMCAYKSE